MQPLPPPKNLSSGDGGASAVKIQCGCFLESRSAILPESPHLAHVECIFALAHCTTLHSTSALGLKGNWKNNPFKRAASFCKAKALPSPHCALGPQGREGNLITVPTSSVLLHDEEACFFDVGGREWAANANAIFSAIFSGGRGRRFPVIRRQCKHSLSSPLSPPD